MAVENETQEQPKEISESQIEIALLPRLQYFKENAESFNLERVRRLIEEDLGIEQYSIDAHKSFIKQFLEKHLENLNEDSAPKDSGEGLEKDTPQTKDKVEKSSEEYKTKKNVKGSGVGDEKKLEDSPVMGLMDSIATSADAQDAKASESSIKKAILERAAYFRDNAEAMTLVSVRRYLEEEMGLEKNSLDPFKKFIRAELDKVLNSTEVPSPKEDINTKGTSDSSKSESDTEKRTKPAKKAVPRVKSDKSEGSKKRKSSDGKNDVTKKQKVVKKSSGNNDAEESDRSESEDHQPRSTAPKSTKKKAVSGSGYGEAVEKLKSIIKACGMSIPPSVYKKAKQASEEERQDFLIKELEGILSREGLSGNPSEKEIKEVRKRKDRARELEGIDTSNIVSSSRRRSSALAVFSPLPKPESPVKAEDESGTDGSSSDSEDDADVSPAEDDDDDDVEINEGNDEESE